MLENFIYAKEKSLFEEKLNSGEVLDEAIVFIEDTREIWNHGTYFDGNAVDLSNVEKSIQDILDNIPTKVSDLENDSNYITETKLSDTFDSKLFIGTLEEYNILNSENKIKVGALVIILDQEELENNSSATTSILGTAVIGKMILGNK